MSDRKPADRKRAVEAIELELTKLNARRALTPVEKRLEVAELGGCTLLRDRTAPGSVYYNRIKGFGPEDVHRLDELLALYPEGAPCFDMTPDHLTEETAAALGRKGYLPVEQLVFMEAETVAGGNGEAVDELVIELVTEANAEEYLDWIAASNGGMELNAEAAARARPYFCRSDFRNYMVRIGGQPAAMASLFLHGDSGYLANDYTFAAFRGRGCQSALIPKRLADASGLGIRTVYTDVEFGSVSHGNMEKAGFRTVFLNTFWMKQE
ncbi:hypothetical protein [Gorillibacterium sp. sgz5001074]|uniref:hypothetical protein n=1 Tax=Gorillibacterium sp. sgz5001074 TaxID=3446695 RepID=UPI003F6760AA